MVEFREEMSNTYVLTIFIAGNYKLAVKTCQTYCDKVGLCVSLEKTRYIYTGGEEIGVSVRLINYPRFPTTEEDLWFKAEVLGHELIKELKQESFSILGLDKTKWFSYREVDVKHANK